MIKDRLILTRTLREAF